ncbi:MAG: DMT family transporter, partial [Candidatus Nanopelagicales bacterium]
AGTVAFLAGAVVAVQGRINGELGAVTDDGILAAVVNFSVGLVALVILVSVRPAGRKALMNVPAQLRARTIPGWTLLGGFAGATFVAAQSITVSALGVALFTVATVAGQTGMSLAVDRWGLGPSGALPVSVLRVIAAVMATAAVAVAASGRDSSSGGGARAFIIMALLAGSAVAFQAAFNGRLSVATGQPTVAALINFSVGLVALLVVLAIERARRDDISGALPQVGDKPWLYVGGLLGLVFVVSAAWSVRALGVLLLSLAVIAGSLVGAVAVDVVAPTEGASFTWELIVGILMTFAAVGLASVRKKPAATWQDSGS